MRNKAGYSWWHICPELVAWPHIGTEFFTQSDEGHFKVSFELPTGAASCRSSKMAGRTLGR